MTFVFGEIFSPPEGTYSLKPKKNFRVPVPSLLGSLSFGLHRYNDSGASKCHCSLKIRSKGGLLLLEEKSSHRLHDIETVELGKTEQIVSAWVNQDDMVARDVRFLVFNRDDIYKVVSDCEY